MNDRIPMMLAGLALCAACSETPNDSAEIREINQRGYMTETINGGSIRCSAMNSTQVAPEVSKRYGITRSPDAGILSCTVPDSVSVEANYRPTGRASETIALRQVLETDYPTWVGKYQINSSLPVTFDIQVSMPDSEPEEFVFDVAFGDGV